MEEALLIEKLLLFGLGRQEAAIYLCLLKNSELTGYEVAKLTGISRSNVYNSLASLVEHGAAYVSEGASTRYTAVCLKEFCDNRLRFLKDVGAYLVENGPKPIIPSEGYITVEGYGHICDKIHHMLLGAEKRIYFSASLPVIEQLGEEFTKVLDRKIKLVFITDGMPKEDSFMKDAICYIGDARENSVRLIIDSEYALTGELTGKKDDTCLYTGQDNFIRVFKEALRNEMKLIELTEGENKNE